jgi:hypothetical protein
VIAACRETYRKGEGKAGNFSIVDDPARRQV